MGKPTSQADAEFVRDALASFYDLRVVVLPHVEMPREAFLAARGRYRAEVLLGLLAGRLPNDGFAILGLTADDVSTTKGNVADWGVVGLADPANHACVISSFRCRSGVSREQARTRLAKVALHEVGHTLGLPHCPEQGCMMSDANGSLRTVDGEGGICLHCSDQLRHDGYLVRTDGRFPWLRPVTGQAQAHPVQP